MLTDGMRLVHLRAKGALGTLHTDGGHAASNASAAAAISDWSAAARTQHKGLLQTISSLDLHADSWGPDKFVIYYWFTVLALVAFVVFVVQPVFFPDEEEDEEARMARLESEAFEKLDRDHDGTISKEELIRDEQLRSGTLNPADPDSPEPTARSYQMAPKEVDLPENMWALNLVCSIGQAHSGKHTISAYFTAFITMTMATLQIAVLFLVVHDINPNASPVTTVSSDPWIHTGWTVNCMKWLMVTFMCLLMVTEAGECRVNMTCILETNSHRLQQSRLFLGFVCIWQYIIMLFVIWGGVAAVLSFQSVPDILYSSMSITYIAKVDEAFYVMLMQLMDIEADFHVVHGRKATKMSAESVWASLDADGDGAVTREEFHNFQEQQQRLMLDDKLKPEHIPHWVGLVLHFLAAFPCLLGIGMIGRAMHTNVMPTQRLHDMKDAILAIANAL